MSDCRKAMVIQARLSLALCSRIKRRCLILPVVLPGVSGGERKVSVSTSLLRVDLSLTERQSGISPLCFNCKLLKHLIHA